MARASGDPAALGYALASLCDVRAAPDAAQRRAAITAEIVASAAAAEDTQLELLGRRQGIVALLEIGDLDGVDAEITQFAKRAEALRQPLYEWYVPLWQGMRAAMSGRIDLATKLCQQAVRLGEAAHSENAAMLTESQQHALRCECGDASPAFEFYRRTDQGDGQAAHHPAERLPDPDRRNHRRGDALRRRRRRVSVARRRHLPH
jgi:hypothetical protein